MTINHSQYINVFKPNKLISQIFSYLKESYDRSPNPSSTIVFLIRIPGIVSELQSFCKTVTRAKKLVITILEVDRSNIYDTLYVEINSSLTKVINC